MSHCVMAFILYGAAKYLLLMIKAHQKTVINVQHQPGSSDVSDSLAKHNIDRCV